MDPRLERIARNESLFRRVNEAIGRVSEDFEDEGLAADGADIEFHCECGREDCVERFIMTVEAYEAVHRERDRFVVVPTHVTSPIEDVVEQAEAYVVVDKRREAESFLDDSSGRPPS